MTPTPRQCCKCPYNGPAFRSKTVNGVKEYTCKRCAAKGDARKRESKPRKAIPKESARRKRERPIYTRNKNKALEERPYCELKIPNICTGMAQGMQHKKGRTGSLYLDMTYQATSCNACNGYADTHPEEAVKMGWAVWRIKKAS